MLISLVYEALPRQARGSQCLHKATRHDAAVSLHQEVQPRFPAWANAALRSAKDFTVRNGSATVVAILDGTGSLYLSSGGGFIGGGQSHESIRSGAKKTVEIANQAQHLMQPATNYPLPQPGEVTFYVLTKTGVFTASTPERDLQSQSNPLSSLYQSAQTIVTAYRLISTKKSEGSQSDRENPHGPPLIN